ncbi:MAG TPA: type II secretion system protein [Anaerohalosphaeraceae bacterium]|nr:type II secretion system protein [Anaerohalosphaeraceae bacterium]HQG05866.1 type II secretion system protein [Anaerohalosphaeraceae bacterium]HQI06713.1 type II secretion system protein [Anaerohalosphaeraceae bacterium]HQJ67409.1 type II secretion system protein [Anaerohalosphaeraceae bacterium]
MMIPSSTILTDRIVKRRKGFTLIELLVVISIIGLLLSVLIPALSKAKRFAEEIVCKNNLHQYQLVTEMYAQENKELLPIPQESIFASDSVLQAAGEVQKYCRWHNPLFDLDEHPEFGGPLQPYLQVAQVSVCPVFRKLSAKYASFHPNHNTAVATGVITFSLTMNGNLQRMMQPDTYVFKSIRKTEIRSPSQVFLWAEENMWTLNDMNGNPLSSAVLNDTTLLAGSDCFASFHQLSAGKIEVQIGTGTYNGGSSNVLMCDGSAITATPEETRYYAGKRFW